MERRATKKSSGACAAAAGAPLLELPVLLELRVLLSDADVGLLLLKPLTVQEAGRLSGACRTALALVRRGEASEAETGARVFRPMWNTDGAIARLQRYRQCAFRPYLAGELESLARLVLDELVPAGIVGLFFSLDKARNGQPPTLLGCHELRVADPVRWVLRLQEWALADRSTVPDFRHKYPGGYVTNLLRDMRLMGTTRDDFAPAVPESLPEEVLSSSRRLCVRMWVKEW